MRVVVDTNVLVLALLSRFGPPGVIVSLTAAGRLSLWYDARILAEYTEVLHRPAFPLDADVVAALTTQIEAGGVMVSPVPLTKRLPDAADEPFLEVAVAARAEYLVTGNSAHLPPECRAGVQVAFPREFIDSARVRYDRGAQRDEERAAEGMRPRTRRRSRRRPSPSGPARSRSSSQAAILRSRRPTATPRCRPTSREGEGWFVSYTSSPIT